MASTNYKLTFKDTKDLGGTGEQTRQTVSYSVYDDKEYTETFFLIDTSFSVLKVQNIDEATVVVRYSDGSVVDSSKYILDAAGGSIRAKNFGDFSSRKNLQLHINITLSIKVHISDMKKKVIHLTE